MPRDDTAFNLSRARYQGSVGLAKYRRAQAIGSALNANRKDPRMKAGPIRLKPKASVKLGGGASRQKRVPAGSPRGGQFTK